MYLDIIIIIEIAAVLNMNNLAGRLVYCYDVGNSIFKYTRGLHISATTCMVQPTIIRNGIGYTLIRLQRQAAMQVPKNIGTMAYVSTTYNPAWPL